MTRAFPRPAGELPPVSGRIERLVAIIGPDAALALCEARGGTAIYIPHPPITPEHQLARLIGVEATMRLAASAEAHAGDMLKVPLGRDWRIAIYRDAGLSHARIALLLGIDENTVHRSLQKQQMTHQLDMFD